MLLLCHCNDLHLYYRTRMPMCEEVYAISFSNFEGIDVNRSTYLHKMGAKIIYKCKLLYKLSNLTEGLLLEELK